MLLRMDFNVTHVQCTEWVYGSWFIKKNLHRKQLLSMYKWHRLIAHALRGFVDIF